MKASVPLLLVAALCAACGTTVPTAGQGNAAATSGAGGALGTGGGLDGTPTTGLTPGAGSTGGGTSGGGASSGATSGTGAFTTGTTGQTGTPGGTTTGGGTTATSGTTGGNSTSTANMQGVTATDIYVGLIYDKNAGAVNNAAGIGAISSGDSKANEKAIIDDINKNGGIAGRKLVPVYADFDSNSTQTLDQQFAAVCETFTRDSPRVMVAATPVGEDSYRNCLNKAGVPLLSNSLPTIGQADLMRYPTIIEQGYPNVDRLAAYQVTPLVDQKYFTPWNNVSGEPAATGVVKVGILTYSDKVFAPAVKNYLVPALKKLGYDPIVAEINQVTTASDYSSQAAAVKSAQLTFASNGVTHVIPFESNGGLSTLFLPTARSQGYYPRYGISSASAFEALNEAGIVDEQQLNGAVGFGWIPSVDLASADNPPTGKYSNANRRYCLKVLQDAGITFDSGNAEVIGLTTCAALYLLKAALEKTPQHITLQTFLSSVESLGTSYQKAGTVGQEFRPGRHDPSNRAYHWAYVPSCNCFRYSGSANVVP